MPGGLYIAVEGEGKRMEFGDQTGMEMRWVKVNGDVMVG